MGLLTEHITEYKHLRLQVRRYGDTHGYSDPADIPGQTAATGITDSPGRNRRPDLLFLHGFLGSGDQFRHLFPGLSDLVYPVTVAFLPAEKEQHDASKQAVPGLPTDFKRPGASSDTPLQESLSKPSPEKPLFHTDTLVEALDHVITNFLHPSPYVLGYSMGGRLVMSWAVQHPGKVRGIILESTTPGIADPAEREKRRQADAERSASMKRDYSAFLDSWEENDLFQTTGRATQGPADVTRTLLKSLRAIQRSRDPGLMAHWLAGFGTGTMPPVWDKLHLITTPSLLLTGSLDQKFSTIAESMARHLPDGRHHIIADSAHRVHIDAPDAYLTHIRSFISP